jgi:DNA-binding phage protein
MSEKFDELIGPRSLPHESADCLNHAFETSDIAEICKAIGVVAHRPNISDIAKKAELKDRAFIELLQAAQSIQILRLF